MKTDNVPQNQANVKLPRICSAHQKDHSNVPPEFVSNNQTYVSHKTLEMEMKFTSKKLTELNNILILDVLLNNHSDVLMVHAEIDSVTVQSNQDVHK